MQALPTIFTTSMSVKNKIKYGWQHITACILHFALVLIYGVKIVFILIKQDPLLNY
jgi:hypothetical protein